MLTIALQAVPSQILQVTLGTQPCAIAVYQKFFGLHLDLSVSNALIIGGVLCQNQNRIVRDAYLGFSGDLIFFDNQGTTDPIYTGLGSRYTLLYLTPTDLAGFDLDID